MDTPEKVTTARKRYGLLLTALAPVVPQILGSAFNIWYNTTVIQPLLVSPGLKQRFIETIIIYNVVAFPIGIVLWLRRIMSFRELFHGLCAGMAMDSASLATARRRLIHLPWFAAAISGVAWFLCIPVFIGALLQVQNPLDPRLLWHLPISF
jgi:adenylate cyclase